MNPAASGAAAFAPGRRIWAAVIVAVLFSGAAFRLAEYFANRSLWLDEAALAQNVLHRSPVELLRGQLDADQCAPPGFLLASRAVAEVFGGGEWALRLIPLLAGLAFMAIFGWQAWRRLGPVGALAASALAAWSWPLIYYSNEFKPYSTDMLIAFLLFAWGGAILSQPLNARKVGALAMAGCVALFFSQPAIFMLAALGTLGWARAGLRREWGEAAKWMAAGAGWLLFFAAELRFAYGPALANANLFSFYQGTFLRLWPPAELQGSLQGAESIGILLTSETFFWFWFALFALGVWFAPAEKFVILLAIFFTALASWLDMYPLVARLVLFLAAPAFWLVAHGADRIAAINRRGLAPWAGAALLIPLWPMLCDGVKEARRPTFREHLRPVVAELAQQAQPGDLVLVWPYSRSAFDYYWSRVAHPEVAVAAMPLDPDQPMPTAPLAGKLTSLTQGHPRIWIIATHYEFGLQPQNLRTLTGVLRLTFPSVEEFSQQDGALKVRFSKTGGSPPR